jgi:hypothetical protein
VAYVITQPSMENKDASCARVWPATTTVWLNSPASIAREVLQHRLTGSGCSDFARWTAIDELLSPISR